MPNTLKVTLDKSTNPWCLDIDQKDNANHVSRGPDTQTITWKLEGQAASGSFNSQGGSQPGFAWISNPAPPAGIFGDPVLCSNNNEMTMSDLNNSAATAGDWIYQLSATIGGVVYQSITASITAQTTNPTIKNN